MKPAYTSIVAVMLIVIAVALAGCTSQTTTTSSGGSGTSSTGSPSSTASSSSPQVGSTVSSSSVFGTNYNWMEYQVTSTSGGKDTKMDMKMERSADTYQGQPATHIKVTMTSSTNAMSGVYDYYYDSAMSTILGGTMTITVNGKTMTMNIPATQLSQTEATNFNKASPLTFAGIEPVSVPAGTYPTASKYTKSENGIDVTFWSAPGVPVPVKMASSSSTTSTTSELVGWG